MNPAASQITKVIANGLMLSDRGRALLETSPGPRPMLDALRAAGCHVDALHWLPHLLDKRRAIWWACLCFWDAYRDRLTPAQADALRVVLRWLLEPNEANRAACLVDGQVPNLNAADNCLRMAAHWSAGSMSPPELPEVLPPPQVTAKLSTAAALIAASSRGMFEVADKHALYLNLGFEVLEGRLDWGASAAPVLPEDISVVA